MSVALRVPEELWPALAYHASRRHYIPAVAVRTLIDMIGKDKLHKALGRKLSRPMVSRFC